MEQKNIVYRFQQIDNVHEIFIFDDIRKTGPFNWDTWQYEDSETSAKHFREEYVLPVTQTVVEKTV